MAPYIMGLSDRHDVQHLHDCRAESVLLIREQKKRQDNSLSFHLMYSNKNLLISCFIIHSVRKKNFNIGHGIKYGGRFQYNSCSVYLALLRIFLSSSLYFNTTLVLFIQRFYAISYFYYSQFS